MRVQQHQTRGRFLGFTYGCLILMFIMMAGSTVLAMYSRGFRHFIHNKITIIVVGVFMIILALVFMCFEQMVKQIQAIFFFVFALGLALLTGSLVTHLKSMIVVYAILLTLVLVIGLAIIACIL